ncbi:hypothetical protein GC096_30545 [Paenibacillus sp. LMG 31461]|uniref:Uncharacterized protein n=1 Tax=Paenibacillus plantarum TaxID=2654975 RepID=A0ABX1XIZ2_9BACL|nr:hypothetical protein [Paenibacillus plantarum]NOU68369.1 hypothetical protein [Paenibacillus plantarum]
MLKIRFEDITYLDNHKIKYSSLPGEEKEIIFQDCNNNYIKQKQNSNIVNRCVGVRDITANPPFIGLYSDPPAKVIFSSEEAFGDFRNKIHKFDWITLDLS